MWYSTYKMARVSSPAGTVCQNLNLAQNSNKKGLSVAVVNCQNDTLMAN